MGDVTGDGLADLFVGAPYADADDSDGGAVYFVAGAPSSDASLVSLPRWTGANAGNQLGTAVAAGGDLDGDGIGDLLVGAPYLDAGGEGGGGAYLLLGPLDGSESLADADARVLGDDANDFAGAALAFAGDVDGDGAEDLLVGAFGDDTSGIDAGTAAVFYGRPAGDRYLSTADARLTGETTGDFAARSVAAVGDLDGDGFGDVAVSAHYRDGSAGAAYVMAGPVYGLVSLATATARLFGEAGGDFAGIGVTGGGDIDADGAPDLVVGAPASDRGAVDGGVAYVLLGGSW
jgi:hypothetical protein